MSDISKARKKKLLERKKKLKEGAKGNFLFPKADTPLRVRVLPVNEDDEPGKELIQFYLGNEIKGVISPKTIGEPCPILEKHEELKKSKDEDDIELANKLKPKNKFVVAVIVKKDKAGKEVDEAQGIRLLLIPKSAYQQMIDYFLEDEQGDFTHPTEGYDLKINRTGSTQLDTEYTVIPCKPSPLPKKYNKTVDVEELLRKEIPSYDDCLAKLNQFLGVDSDEEDNDDEDSARKRKMKKKKAELSGKKKKKKRSSDDLPY